MSEIEQALRMFHEGAVEYQRYYDYYNGRHDLAFATEKFRGAFGSLFREFADNLCAAVVNAVMERLIVIGFDVEEGSEEAAEQAWQIWLRNRMDRRSRQVHLEALRSGNAYVVVWPGKEGGPVLYPNWGALMRVRYDEEIPGHILWASKLWVTEDNRYRLNMYFPDRIEKYISRASSTGIPERENSFEPFVVPGEPWPLPNPYGRVPVVHFTNTLSDGEMGRSELADVIPLQDALNKAVADMLVAMEFVSFPQRWATGIEVDVDEMTGKPKAPFKPGVDRVWTVANEMAKFGQFDPADLKQFLEVQENLRLEIARVSGIPLHYLMLQRGEFPSGEALKTAEARFTAKITDKQIIFGNCWEDVMALAVLMAGGPEARLSTLWRDAAPRSEKEMVETVLLKQQAGVSQQQCLRELGYSQEQIEQMMTEREANSAQLGDQLLTAFEHGE